MSLLSQTIPVCMARRQSNLTREVLVHGVIRVEAIQRIYVAGRELDNSTKGKFTLVSPPTR